MKRMFSLFSSQVLSTNMCCSLMLKQIIFLVVISLIRSDQDCECVPFYLCHENNTINTNGINIIDIRSRRERSVDNCSYLQKCCKPPKIQKKSMYRKPPVSTGCGYSNPDGVGYKIAGAFDNEAQFGEFPWTVAILSKKEENFQFTCVGTLIHPQVVITAAHCVINAKFLKVRAGEWDTKTTDEVFEHQERKVASGVVHAQFNRKMHNDIGLLFLDSPFDIRLHINVACLPKKVVSTNCIVSGWGKDRFESDAIYQNILKKVEVPLVEHDQCEKLFQKTRLSKEFRLHRSFLCAGGQEGRDACTGDGGGPLICPIDGQEDRYQLVGIVSWGIGCGQKDVPGAYTNVAYFREWIDKQMINKNFNNVTYQFS